jgi:hypothetical protein
MRRATLAWAALALAAVAHATDAADTNLWFHVGEELTYRVYWGRLRVGTCQITTEWVQQNGRRLLAIRYRTRSHKVIESLYPVDDFIESLIDPDGFRPVRFEKRLSEGRHRSHEITTFDYDRKLAIWEAPMRKRRDEIPIAADTRDLVSFLYFIRGQGLDPGTVKQYQVMTDEKVYDVWVKTGLLESVPLPGYGRIPSLRVDPEAAFNGLFMRKGKVTVWVSNDARHIVTRIVASVPVASIKVVLEDVRGPGDDFWIRMKEKKPGPEPSAGKE